MRATRCRGVKGPQAVLQAGPGAGLCFKATRPLQLWSRASSGGCGQEVRLRRGKGGDNTSCTMPRRQLATNEEQGLHWTAAQHTAHSRQVSCKWPRSPQRTLSLLSSTFCTHLRAWDCAKRQTERQSVAAHSLCQGSSRQSNNPALFAAASRPPGIPASTSAPHRPHLHIRVWVHHEAHHQLLAPQLGHNAAPCNHGMQGWAEREQLSANTWCIVHAWQAVHAAKCTAAGASSARPLWAANPSIQSGRAAPQPTVRDVRHKLCQVVAADRQGGGVPAGRVGRACSSQTQ